MLKGSDIKMKNKKNLIIIILSIILTTLIIVAIISYKKYNKEKEITPSTSEIEKKINTKYKDDGFQYKLKSQNKNNIIVEKINKKTKKIVFECRYNVNNEELDCYTIPVKAPCG